MPTKLDEALVILQNQNLSPDYKISKLEQLLLPSN